MANEKYDQAICLVNDGRWTQGAWFRDEDEETGEPGEMCLGGLMLWFTHYETSWQSSTSLAEVPECHMIAEKIRELFPERMDSSCWVESTSKFVEEKHIDATAIVVFNDYPDTTADDVIMVLKLAKEDEELALAEEVEMWAKAAEELAKSIEGLKQRAKEKGWKVTEKRTVSVEEQAEISAREQMWSEWDRG